MVGTSATADAMYNLSASWRPIYAVHPLPLLGFATDTLSYGQILTTGDITSAKRTSSVRFDHNFPTAGAWPTTAP